MSWLKKYVNNTGYLKGKKTNKNPINIIPSNHITTDNMAFPIYANGVLLYPNTGDYMFPTNMVVETPAYQPGGSKNIPSPVAPGTDMSPYFKEKEINVPYNLIAPQTLPIDNVANKIQILPTQEKLINQQSKVKTKLPVQSKPVQQINNNNSDTLKNKILVSPSEERQDQLFIDVNNLSDPEGTYDEFIGNYWEVPKTAGINDTVINLTNMPMGWFNFNTYPGQNYTDILGNNYLEVDRLGTGKPEDYAKNWKVRMQDPNDTFRNEYWAKDAGSYYHSKDIPAFYGIENNRIKVGKPEDFNENTVIVPVRNGVTPYEKVDIEEGKNWYSKAKKMFFDIYYAYDKNNNPLWNLNRQTKFLVHSPITKQTIFLSNDDNPEFLKNELDKFRDNNPGAYIISMDQGRFQSNMNAQRAGQKTLNSEDFKQWTQNIGADFLSYLERNVASLPFTFKGVADKEVKDAPVSGPLLLSPVQNGNKNFGYNIGILESEPKSSYQPGGIKSPLVNPYAQGQNPLMPQTLVSTNPTIKILPTTQELQKNQLDKVIQKDNSNRPVIKQNKKPDPTSFNEDDLKVIQLGLDVGQMIPLTSFPSYIASLPFTTNDVVNDLSKKEYKQAGLDALGYIPTFKAFKYGLKGDKVLDTSSKLAKQYRKINHVVNIANFSNDANQIKKQNGGWLNNYADGGEIEPEDPVNPIPSGVNVFATSNSIYRTPNNTTANKPVEYNPVYKNLAEKNFTKQELNAINNKKPDILKQDRSIPKPVKLTPFEQKVLEKEIEAQTLGQSKVTFNQFGEPVIKWDPTQPKASGRIEPDYMDPITMAATFGAGAYGLGYSLPASLGIAADNALFNLPSLGKGIGKLALKNVPKPTSISSSVDDVSKNLNEIYKNRTFLTDESKGIKNIPWNTKTNKSVQDEFIIEQIEYMNSPAFAEKMKTYYPDVDIEQYKKAILHNLENKITATTKSYPNASLNNQVAGWYTAKENLPNNTFIMPGYKPSFASKVRLANEEILKPAYQYLDDAGKSFTKSLGSTVEHELGHQRTNADWLLPDYLTKEYLTENLTKEGNMLASQEANSPFGFFNYHSEPTEFDTRLFNMKKDLKRQGIIDYTKSNDFTEELLNKLDVSNSRPTNIAEELKEIEVGFLKGDYTKEQYEKLKNFYEKSKNLITTSGDFTVTKDTKDLLKYWNTKFLAEEMKKLPAILPYIGIGGAGLLGAGALQQNKQEYGKGGLFKKKGGQMIKRADGSYSQRGLWDNIRANKGSGKKPTKAMLEQERKIKNKYQEGGEKITIPFNSLMPNTAVQSSTLVNNNPAKNWLSNLPELAPEVKNYPIKIKDNRKINTVTNAPINPKTDLKSGDYNYVDIKNIVDASNAVGVDPNLALAIALQESNLGKTDLNYGHVTKDFLQNAKTSELQNYNYDALQLAYAINNKIGKKPLNAYNIQAYNGYGKLGVNTEKGISTSGNKSGVKKWYGVDVTKEPLDLKKNPAYGKTILDLYNNVILPNKEIQDIINYKFDFSESKQSGGWLKKYK